MINAGIVGATGYAGEELIDLLLKHPQVRIVHVSAKIEKVTKLSDIFPKFKGRIELLCQLPYPKDIVAKCDVVFLALPHTVSMKIAPLLLKQGKKVVDLSADYRLKDTRIYEKYYGVPQTDAGNLKVAVYGLPEIYRVKIKNAKLIANPGCYPTVSLLALAPLMALEAADRNSIIIDAKSGVTGAGRKIAEGDPKEVLRHPTVVAWFWLAEEIGHEFVGRFFDDLLRTAQLDYPSAVHNGKSVRKLYRFENIVGHE